MGIRVLDLGLWRLAGLWVAVLVKALRDFLVFKVLHLGLSGTCTSAATVMILFACCMISSHLHCALYSPSRPT